MQGRFRSLFSHRVRRLAAFLCLGAVSAQLTLPVLHTTHEGGNFSPAALLSPDPSPALHSSASTAPHGEGHDPAACPACRTASQLQGGAPAAAAQLLPIHVFSLIGLAEGETPPAEACASGFAARAPPLAA